MLGVSRVIGLFLNNDGVKCLAANPSMESKEDFRVADSITPRLSVGVLVLRSAGSLVSQSVGCL